MAKKKGSKKDSHVQTETTKIPRKVVAEIVDHDSEQSLESLPVSPADTLVPLDPDTSLENLEAIESLLPVEAKPKAITSTDPLVMYLNEVRKFPVLSREDEMEIAKKYFETKDPMAAQKLVRANLRFVVKVAAEYSRFGAKMIDLIQEGNVGLVQAVKDFNPYKGARLITYAVWWIRGYIQEYLMKQYSIVRIGTTQNQRKLFYQLQREKESLDKLMQSQQIGLLSAKLEIPEDEVKVMVERMSGRDVSLDKPMDNESGESFKDMQSSTTAIGIDDQMANQEELHMLKEVLDDLRPELTERENILLEERLLSDEPLTLQEIGEKYGITREAVRQAETRLMKKIREKMSASLKGND
ncbi:MAG: RNA polymerase factor sigma-32 [Bdellovibrionota bacterium]